MDEAEEVAEEETEEVAEEDAEQVRRIFDHVHDKDTRYELNLYVVGEEEEPDGDAGEAVHADAAGSHLPEERSPNQ